MKAKLLRRLRRKYAKKYCITKSIDGWKVWYGKYDCSYWLVRTIEEAWHEIKSAISRDITIFLEEMRKKRGRRHGIKYYPWVITLFVFFPIFAFAQTRADVLKELHRQKVPHAQIVLAQARLESGNFKSDFYRKTNNLFGLKKGKKYATYKHWRDSIKDYKLRISSRYNGGSYYKFLKRIGYAKDKEYNKKLKKIAK